MIVKGIIDEDFVNYKLPSMFIIFPTCSFKCDKECGRPICQNSSLAREPIIEIDTKEIIHRYLDNPLTHAVVCGGLETFDSAAELSVFITLFRVFSQDPIVIYTGYTEEELADQLTFLQKFDNIIIKFGRFIPDSPHIFDTVLGVELASNNQYAKNISRGMWNEYSTTNSGEDSVHEH